METRDKINQLFNDDKYNSLPVLLNALNSLLCCNIQTMDSVSAALIDTDFLEEIRTIAHENVPVYFGKTLRNLKCGIQDDSGREHEVCFCYNGPKKLLITSTMIPHTSLQDREFNSIEEIILTFKKHLGTLAPYFYELERIDRLFTIMEPLKPSFKDEYRRIFLDERAWLHIEVTPDGMATNIHLVGQCDRWNDKLQEGLISWDHDKDIVDNIMSVFALEDFPVPSTSAVISVLKNSLTVDVRVCNICLCDELPDQSGLPQPLCQNSVCGVFFHRNCLFQWLVACSGGRYPPFGVANGSCPNCLLPISCGEKDG